MEDDAEETVFFEDEDGVVVFAPGEADGVGDTNGWVDDDGFDDIVNWFQNDDREVKMEKKWNRRWGEYKDENQCMECKWSWWFKVQVMVTKKDECIDDTNDKW